MQSEAERIVRKLREINILERFGNTVGGIENEARFWPVALREIVKLMGAQEGCVGLYRFRQDRIEVAWSSGAPDAWSADLLRAYFRCDRPEVPSDMAIAPIYTKAKRLGVLAIRRPGGFAPELKPLFKKLTARTGEEAGRLREQRLNELHSRIARKLIQGLRPNDVLYHVLDALYGLIGYDHSGGILILDDTKSRLTLRAEKIVWQKEKSDLIGRLFFMEPSTADLLLQERWIRLVREPGNSWIGCPYAESLIPILAFNRWPPEQSILAVPLRFQGRLVGLLKLSATRPLPFTPGEAEVAERLSELAAAAIHRLLQETEEQECLESLLIVSSQIASGQDRRQVMQGIAREVTASMGYRACCFRFLDSADRLIIRSCSGLPASCLDNAAYAIPIGREPLGMVALTGEPAAIAHLPEAPPEYHLPDFVRQESLESMLALPIYQGSQVVGVLDCYTQAYHEFSEEEIQILSIFASQAATVAQNLRTADQMTRLQDELQQTLEAISGIGRQIQMALISQEPFEDPAFTILGRCDPAHEVGGSFYSIVPLENEMVAVFLGDVTGKDIPAAMYMVMAKTCLEALAHHFRSPSRLLQAANAFLYDRIHPQGIRVTALCGLLDLHSQELHLANAGHPDPLLHPLRSRPDRLSMAGSPLGADRNLVYEEILISLHPGDRLLMATDGFIEARDRNGIVLGHPGLASWMARWRRYAPAIMLEKIFWAIDRHIPDRRYRDDLTLVVIAAKEGPEEGSHGRGAL